MRLRLGVFLIVHFRAFRLQGPELLLGENAFRGLQELVHALLGAARFVVLSVQSVEFDLLLAGKIEFRVSLRHAHLAVALGVGGAATLVAGLSRARRKHRHRHKS